MKKRQSSDPLWQLDGQGNLHFGLREKLVRRNHRPDTALEHPAAAWVFMFFFGLLDLIMFKDLFGTFLYAHQSMQLVSIIALLAGFDVAPICLGVLLKKHEQKLPVSKLAAAILTGAFVLALALNITLRAATKDRVLPDFSVKQTAITSGQPSADHEPLANAYAVFAAFAPLLTSGVSFAVSHMSANPLKNRLKSLALSQVQLEDEITQLEAVLTEYDMDEDRFRRQLDSDEALQANLIRLTREKAFYCFDYVRERLKEHLGDPTSSNILSKDQRQALESLLHTLEERASAPQPQPLVPPPAEAKRIA